MTEQDVCTALEAVVKECSLAALENHAQFAKAFTMARGIGQLRQMITPDLMKQIMPLMNTALGFQTDKNPANKDKTGRPLEPYGESIVKECFIEATLRGLSPVGNEWNILAGRVYATKNGLARKLRELKGFTDFKPVFGTPKQHGESAAIVETSATWKMNGIEDRLERPFVIKVNYGMGSDAIVGKAERKMRAAVLEQITGSRLSEGDIDDTDAIPTTARTETPLAEKLKAKATGDDVAALRDKLKAMAPADLAKARGALNLATPIEQLTATQCQALINQVNTQDVP